MVAAPTRVGRYSPASGNYASVTTPKVTTETFDMLVGDRFWCQGQVENAGSQSVVTPSVSAGAVAWTLEARVPAASNANVSALWGWSGVCTSAATGVTATLARPTTATDLWWGFSVTHVRGSAGVGTIFSNNNGTGSGAPLDSRVVSANSLVIFNVNDWNAADGGNPRPYRMGATESNYFRDALRHTVYGAYVLDTAAGTFDAGLTTTGMRWGLIGIEFLGIDTVGVPALQESGAGILLEDGTKLLF